MIKKKIYIKKVNVKDPFKKVSFHIMKYKLKIVRKTIKKYLENDSVDNLHTMRIAIRRMRYSLEVFYGCFESKLFENVYNYLQYLQDVVGELRDLDVFEEKLQRLASNEGVVIPENLYKNIILEKETIRQTIKRELIKFTSDKQVNQFLKK